MQASFEYESIHNTSGENLTPRISRILSFVLILLSLSVVFFAGRRSIMDSNESPSANEGDLAQKYSSIMVNNAATLVPSLKPTPKPTSKPSQKPTAPTRKPSARPRANPTRKPTTSRPVSQINGITTKPTIQPQSCMEAATISCASDALCLCDDENVCQSNENSISNSWMKLITVKKYCLA